jgi:hypothetical protein
MLTNNDSDKENWDFLWKEIVQSGRMEEWAKYVIGILKIFPERENKVTPQSMKIGDMIVIKERDYRSSGSHLQVITEIFNDSVYAGRTRSLEGCFLVDAHLSTFAKLLSNEKFDEALALIKEKGGIDNLFLSIDDWIKGLSKDVKHKEIAQKIERRALWETSKKRKIDKIMGDEELALFYANKIQKLEEVIEKSKADRAVVSQEHERKTSFEYLNNHIFFLFARKPRILEFLFRHVPFATIKKYDLLLSPNNYDINGTVFTRRFNQTAFWKLIIDFPYDPSKKPTRYLDECIAIVSSMLKGMSLVEFFSCVSSDYPGRTEPLLFSPFFPSGYSNDITNSLLEKQADNKTFLWILEGPSFKKPLDAESEDFDSSDENFDLKLETRSTIELEDLRHWIQQDPMRICKMPLRACFQKAVNQRQEKILIRLARYSPKEPDNLFKLLPKDIFKHLFDMLDDEPAKK